MIASTAALAFPGEAPPEGGRRLTADLRPEDAGLTWYVVRAATRREKVAEENLVAAGMVVYTPRLARWRRLARKKVRLEVPLFPGYLFVGLRMSQSMYALEATEAVHGVVRFTRERDPVPVNFAPIRKILQMEQDGEFDKTRRRRKPDPEQGDKITIDGGMFQGLSATFIKRRADERIEVLIELFGRSSPAVLKADQVAETREFDG